MQHNNEIKHNIKICKYHKNLFYTQDWCKQFDIMQGADRKNKIALHEIRLFVQQINGQFKQCPGL